VSLELERRTRKLDKMMRMAQAERDAIETWAEARAIA